MANWLSKYEQGGMVLKQKTKDNYGKQSNYNDAKVSTPPGYVGMGYDTKGRNYSPAWGGQFQDGGILGKTFLQPNSSKLPAASTPGGKKGQMSTELAMSIGGEGGQPGYLIPTFKYGKPLADPEAEFRQTGEHLGGPFKTWQAAEKWGKERHKFVEKGQSVPSPTKTWDEFAMGGGLPGATGMMYARTVNPAPSNGKYTKKTKASAQNGSVIKDDMGQWAHPGEITEIGSNDITMYGVDYPVLGVSDTGHTQMMQPNQDYKFDGEKVTEFPMMQKGGWLDKYQDGGNINKKLKEEAEDRLSRMNRPKSIISQYTPKPGEQAKFDKQKLERIAEDNAPLNRMAASKGAENMQDAIEAALIMEGGMFAGKLIGKGAKAAGKYLTEETALKNAYKLNPKAFKPTEGMMYRGIGEGGMKDALESGVFRARQRGENLYFNDRVSAPMNKSFGKAYYSPDFRVADSYGKGYVAEVSSDAATFNNRYSRGKVWSKIAQEDIPIDKGKILKKDWLKGYKEVPKKE